MTQKRQLAAIMFTDIVGYTALMGEDEDKAYRLIIKNRDIQKPLIEKHGGTWLKEMGDGTLASFPSISEAVYCAKGIQEACLHEPELNLRIGIHLGEVIIEEGDVFGDGVNIASRIEALAPAGGICISESVFQNIQNMKRIETEYIQEVKLKNVKRPVRIYQVNINGKSKSRSPKLASHRKTIISISVIIALLMIVAIVRYFYPLNQSAVSQEELLGNPDDLSIAVLPFVNMSSDPDQEYFSDGITEEIITHLAKIGDLSVISRTSVFQYKNKPISLPVIAKELNVAYILEGSVRKQGNTLRITAQLIHASSDKHLWAENFDRQLSQVLDVQTDVAKKVAEVLNIKLTEPEVSRIERKATEKYSAYEYYLKAIYEDKKWTPEGAKQAIAYLQKAIELDPEFSEAYSLYAWQYVNLGTLSSLFDPKEALNQALPLARKSVDLDSLSSDAFLVLGSVNFYLEWDFVEAKKNFEQSMELNSWGEAPIYQCICAYVEFLIANNHIEETWSLFKNINKIDPAFFQVFDYESLLHIANNNYDIALDTFEKRLEFSELEDWNLYKSYGTTLYLTNNYQEAALKLEKALSMRKERDAYILTYLSLTYLHLNRQKESMKILNELKARSTKGEYGMNILIALIYNELGDEMKTFEYLEKAYNSHDNLLTWVNVNHFKNLKDDPRYLELLRKIGFEV